MEAKPTHPPAQRRYIAQTFGRAEVLALCRKAGYGRHRAEQLFLNQGNEARIMLHPCKYARYSKEIVLKVLGTDSRNP